MVDEDAEPDVDAGAVRVVEQRRAGVARFGRAVLEAERRPDRAGERRQDHRRRDPARLATAPHAPAERDGDRSRQREREHEPAPGGRRHPRSSDNSSTSSGSRRRKIATMIPRPTTTSHAATTITTRAKIWPSALPHLRENAISARLPAFSIS